MEIEVFDDVTRLAIRAARDAAAAIEAAIATRGRARVVAATGVSQLAFLDALVHRPRVDWTRVELFQLDEYVGLSPEHPASFHRYVIDRLARPAGIRHTHLLDGTRRPADVIRDVGAAIRMAPVDVAFTGIGENGHLAFNDPPADFETTEPYLLVTLADAARRQQVGEGWFASLDDVPRQAISMSIREILAARTILCVAPEARKAEAVRACFAGPVTPWAPASILQQHPAARIYLDRASAARVPPR